MRASLAAGCGFQLRGTQTLPFESIYLALPVNSPIGAECRATCGARSTNAKVVNDRQAAQAVFELLGETRERKCCAINRRAAPREYQIALRIRFRVLDGKRARVDRADRSASPRATSPSTNPTCWPRNPRKSCCIATCRATWCSRSCSRLAGMRAAGQLMQTRADALAGAAGPRRARAAHAAADRRHSDEPLLALEAAGRAARSGARAATPSARCSMPDARFDWAKLAQATRRLSLFAERRIVEIRMPTGKPGMAGAAALEALAESVPADTLTLRRPPEARPQDQRGALVQRTRRAGTWLDIETIERAPLAAVDRRAAGAAAPERAGRRAGVLCRPRRRQPARRASGNRQARAAVSGGGLSSSRSRRGAECRALRRLQAAGRDAGRRPAAGRENDGRPAGRGRGAAAGHLGHRRGNPCADPREGAVASGRPFAVAARESRIWGPRERLFERALGRLDLNRLERTVARVADIDRLAKGLRAPKADSNPWLELTDIALDVAT